MNKQYVNYLNIDFEKEVDLEKLLSLFLIKFKDSKAGMLVNSKFYSNVKNNKDKVDIFWNISEIDTYKDILLRSYIEFSNDLKTPTTVFLLWLHEISIILDSKIYVEINIQNSPILYFVAWCIDGKTRSLVFEAEEVFENLEFAYCAPVIDKSKFLDSQK